MIALIVIIALFSFTVGFCSYCALTHWKYGEVAPSDIGTGLLVSLVFGVFTGVVMLLLGWGKKDTTNL